MRIRFCAAVLLTGWLALASGCGQSANTIKPAGTPPPPRLPAAAPAFPARAPQAPHISDPNFTEKDRVAIQCLRQVCSAQNRYHDKHAVFSARAADLNADRIEIAPDVMHAFVAWQNNGDEATAVPKFGYVFRMLQGSTPDTPTDFRTTAGDPSAGMQPWAATARPIEPGPNGHFQLLVTADGKIYRHLEVGPEDPNYQQFMLASVPDLTVAGSGWEAVNTLIE